MSTLYNNINSLCVEHGVKGGKMCTDIGISKSTMTGLKKGRTKTINIDTAQKIADYFGVSVDRVLTGEEPEQKEKPAPTNGDGFNMTDHEILDAYNRADEVTRELIRRALGLK